MNLLFIYFLLLFLYTSVNASPIEYLKRDLETYGSKQKLGIGEKYSPYKRQELSDIPDLDLPEEITNEAETEKPKGFFNIARDRVNKVRESAGDFWEGVRDRVSDWFDF